MATEAARANTFPKLLMRNARLYAGRPAYRHKDLGIWQNLDLGAGARRGARLFGRPRGARPQARRHGRHRRRQPAAALLGDVRGAGARRHSGAGLRRLGRRRDGLRARARRGAHRRGRGPGAGRQDPFDRRPAAAARATSSTTSRAACATTTTSGCKSFADVQKLGPRRDSPPMPRRLQRWEAASRGGQGLGPHRHALHLGHHRPAQGRDADPRQPRRLGAQRQSVRQARPDDEVARLSAAGLGRRSLFSYAQAFAAGFCVTCPESPETVDRGPPRDRHRPSSSRRRASSRTCSPRS